MMSSPFNLLSSSFAVHFQLGFSLSVRGMLSTGHVQCPTIGLTGSTLAAVSISICDIRPFGADSDDPCE